VGPLAAAAFACVGCSAIVSQQPSTERQIDAPGDGYETRIVTTGASDDEMDRIAASLEGISEHNPDGELLSVLVFRGTESDETSIENITYSANISVAAHCYERVGYNKTARKDYLLSLRSVWCQRSDYDDSSNESRKLEWDYYWKDNDKLFIERRSALKCFTSGGQPNVGPSLTQQAHDKLCHNEL
jgi:hypothetical protein